MSLTNDRLNQIGNEVLTYPEKHFRNPENKEKTDFIPPCVTFTELIQDDSKIPEHRKGKTCWLHDLSSDKANSKYIEAMLKIFPFVERSIYCDKCKATGFIHTGTNYCRYLQQVNLLEAVGKTTDHLYKFSEPHHARMTD